MRECLPEICREAKTKWTGSRRVILSLQPYILKYRAHSPNAPVGPPVFYGLPDVEHDTGNWTLTDQRYKSDEECGEASGRELALSPMAEHRDRHMLSCLISGMSCDQGWHFPVNFSRDQPS
jgi:hypothetical protein